MLVQDFLASQQLRARRARQLAAHLPRAPPDLPGWRLGDRGLDALRTALRELPSRPSTIRQSRVLQPIAVDCAAGTERQLRRHLVGGAPIEEPLAWTLAELDWLGRWVESRERTVESFPAHPRRDARARELWEALARGHYFSEKGRWEDAFLPAARRAFAGALASRRVPLEVRARAQEQLEDSLFYRLLHMSDGISGWAVLAARTLATAGPGRPEALLDILGPEGRRLAASCAARRGVLADSVARWLPEQATPGGRAAVLALTPELIDFHTIIRLLERWHRGVNTDPDGEVNVVLQSRRRWEARFRALLAEREPTRLMDHVLTLDSLHARTERAVARMCWVWALDELRFGLTMNEQRALVSPCRGGPPLQAMSEEHVRAWLILVVARGRLPWLERWVATGGTGDHDGTWGRLLARELPPCLVNPSSRYRPLRGHLDVHLGSHLAELAPRLESLALLAETLDTRQGRRSLKRRFLEVLGPLPEGMTPPGSGFPTLVRQLVESREQWRQHLDAGGAPCPD